MKQPRKEFPKMLKFTEYLSRYSIAFLILILIFTAIGLTSCTGPGQKSAKSVPSARFTDTIKEEKRVDFNFGGPRSFIKTAFLKVPGTMNWEVDVPANAPTLEFTVGYRAAKNIRPQTIDVSVDVVTENKSDSANIYKRQFISRDPDRLYEYYDAAIDLREFSGQAVKITFSATTSDPAAGKVSVAWGNPIIYESTTSNEKPNIILICVDTLRVDYVDAYRNANDEKLTPRIQQLADDGVVYEDVISQAPWTLPSTASILSGLYPSIHGAGKRVLIGTDLDEKEIAQLRETRGFIYTYKNMVFGIAKLDKKIPIIADLIKDDYLTHFVNSNGFLSERGGIAPRFDSYDDHAYQGFFVSRFANHWLEKNHEKRFFLYLHYLDPHEWYLRYRERMGRDDARNDKEKQFTVQLYHDLVKLTDDYVGDTLDKIRELGLYDDSLIILCSDHGEHFWDDNSGEIKGHGNTMENELLQTPLIVKFPKNQFAGSRVKDNVLNIDIFHTIAEFTGVEMDSKFYRHGRSLKAYAENPGTMSRRDSISEYMMYGPELQCLHHDKIKFVHNIFEDEYTIMDAATDKNLGSEDDLADSFDFDQLKAYLQRYVKMAKEMGANPQMMKLEKHMFQHFRNLGYIQ